MYDKKNLGPLEHQIMDIVWEKKQATVYCVIENLCKEKKLAYTTVMTVMSRLAKKGILVREKIGKTYLYCPKEKKSKYLKILVRNTILKMMELFGEKILIIFADEIKLLLDQQQKDFVKTSNKFIKK